MTITLDSDWIAGTRVYKAVDGVVVIANTYVAGVDLRSVEVVIKTDGDRDITLRLEFSVLACDKGELPGEERKGCFRCSRFSYTFHASEEMCKECEDNAVCDGTTVLVPEEGYWHSSPFSPFMLRCLLAEACSFGSRKESLIDYYNNSTFILGQLLSGDSDFGLDNYKQCASGYEGVICGSCAAGYGHNADGSCSKCSLSLPTSQFLTILIAFILFAVVAVKTVLTLNGMRTEAVFEQEQRKRDVISVLVQKNDKPLSTIQGQDRHPRVISSPPNAEPSLAQSMHTCTASGSAPEIVEEAASENSQTDAVATRPPLKRAERVTDLERSGNLPRLLSSDMMKASTALSDTFNVSTLMSSTRLIAFHF